MTWPLTLEQWSHPRTIKNRASIKVSFPQGTHGHLKKYDKPFLQRKVCKTQQNENQTWGVAQKPAFSHTNHIFLLHSTCKTAETAGFILALLNNNLNKYSADTQRTRILVTWFGKAILTIPHLGTCHVWPLPHKPRAKPSSTHLSLWECLCLSIALPSLRQQFLKKLFFFLALWCKERSTMNIYRLAKPK